MPTPSDWRLLAAGAAGAAACVALGYAVGRRGREPDAADGAGPPPSGPSESWGSAGAARPGGRPAAARAAPPHLREVLPLLLQVPPRSLAREGAAQAARASARAVFAVTSGKGGVGKSTVSVNLAYALRDLGLTVGILDLDIYGPSLPELIPMPPGALEATEDGMIVPFGYAGVGVMSWGYVQPGQATTIRAPLATRCATQLLTMVQWGELDCLVVDTPPGTGDVLLTLTQTLQIDGAVLVTTGNEMSIADLKKGVELLEKVDVPTLAVCHNMAGHTCERCGHESDLFVDAAAEQIPGLMEACPGGELHRIPLDGRLWQAPRGPLPPQVQAYPYVRSPANGDRPAARALRALAEGLLAAFLAGRGAGGAGGRRAELRLRRGGALELRLPGGELRAVPCGVLRAACRCAECVDEFTGEQLLDRERVLADASLRAVSAEAVGNYAAQVRFSDGHSSLVSLRVAEQVAGAGGPTASGGGPAEAW